MVTFVLATYALVTSVNYKQLADVSRPTAGLCHLAPAEGLLASLTRMLALLATSFSGHFLDILQD